MNTLPEYLFAPSGTQSLMDYIDKKHQKDCKIFVLTDENTWKFCLDKFLAEVSLPGNYINISIPSGEENKSLKACETIWKTFAGHYAGRDALLINLGGGVVTDLGGFAASVYKRGIAFVHVPTSLLGMIDAAIGGKTALDFLGLKNILGTFSPAETTYIDTTFLDTLPPEHMRSGFAELLKTALIADKLLWSELKGINYSDIPARPEFIMSAINLKHAIVKKDSMEKGIRKVLNFGHTIGHAVESYSMLHGKNPILHGDAIGMGMICETWLSNKIAGLPEKEMNLIIHKIITSIGKIKLNIEPAELLGIMRNDKKNTGSRISFTLLKNIGDAIFDVHFNEKLIPDAMKFYNKL